MYAKWLDITTYSYIYNKDDLKAFKDLVNSGNSDVNAALMNNIDLDGEEWTPIGLDGDFPFSGVFEGNDCVISNLKINSTDNYQGLFGYVVDGKISDLTLNNVEITGDSYVGAICGYATSNNYIYNCCSISGYISGTGDYIGGLIGCVSAYSSRSLSSSPIVVSCYNAGSVIGIGSYIGGIVGGSLLSHSAYSTSASAAYYYFVSTPITDCYNTGVIEGDKYVGGIIGLASPAVNVTSCYNTGNIIGTNGDIGGVVGRLEYGDDEEVMYTSSSIESCYNSGYIIGGSSSTGGVVGSTYAPVVACYNKGGVSGTGHLGGIAGYLNSIVTSCYNVGSVIHTGTSGYTGGIVGYSFYGTLISCYNTYYVSGAAWYSRGDIAGYEKNTTTTDCFYTTASTLIYESIISTLNTAAGSDYWTFDYDNINDGYPILLSIDN